MAYRQESAWESRVMCISALIIHVPRARYTSEPPRMYLSVNNNKRSHGGKKRGRVRDRKLEANTYTDRFESGHIQQSTLSCARCSSPARGVHVTRVPKPRASLSFSLSEQDIERDASERARIDRRISEGKALALSLPARRRLRFLSLPRAHHHPPINTGGMSAEAGMRVL